MPRADNKHKGAPSLTQVGYLGNSVWRGWNVRWQQLRSRGGQTGSWAKSSLLTCFSAACEPEVMVFTFLNLKNQKNIL